jgi:hypothetical protein
VNYDDACPEGWQKEGPTCVASSQYAGPCVRRYVIGNDRLQKQQFGTNKSLIAIVEQRKVAFAFNQTFSRISSAKMCETRWPVNSKFFIFESNISHPKMLMQEQKQWSSIGRIILSTTSQPKECDHD